MSAQSQQNAANINWEKWRYARGGLEINEAGVTFYKWVTRHRESFTLLLVWLWRHKEPVWQQHSLGDGSFWGYWHFEASDVCLPVAHLVIKFQVCRHALRFYWYCYMYFAHIFYDLNWCCAHLKVDKRWNECWQLWPRRKWNAENINTAGAPLSSSRVSINVSNLCTSLFSLFDSAVIIAFKV